MCSLATLLLLSDGDCSPSKAEAKSLYNPVKLETAPIYLLGVMIMLPMTYAVLSFYEIWAISEYDVDNVVLDTSKMSINVIRAAAASAIVVMTSIWPHRRWLMVGCQFFAVLATAC